jgi:hypothetical protein
MLKRKTAREVRLFLCTIADGCTATPRPSMPAPTAAMGVRRVSLFLMTPPLEKWETKWLYFVALAS